MTQITKEAIEAGIAAANERYLEFMIEDENAFDHAVEAGIRAALPFLPIAIEGKVKALEWQHNNADKDGYDRTGYAKVAWGRYEVFSLKLPSASVIGYCVPMGKDVTEGIGSYDEAVAKCEDHYRAFVQSLLISSPGKDGGQEVEPARGTPEWHMWVGGYGPDFLAGWKAARSYPQSEGGQEVKAVVRILEGLIDEGGLLEVQVSAVRSAIKVLSGQPSNANDLVKAARSFADLFLGDNGEPFLHLDVDHNDLAERYDILSKALAPQPTSTALVEAREAFCGMAEWLLQRKATGVSKYDTNRLFAECQKQRLAIDAALSSSQSTSREGESR